VPEVLGFSHIDFTVSDVERAAQWWQEVMGFTLMIPPRHESTYRIANLQRRGLIVSVMAHDEAQPGAFDERRIGLDHFSFQVADRSELERWAAHLDANGVTNSGVIDTGWGPTVVLRDPDNIQVELYVHPDAATAPELLERGRTEQAERT
jgi:glyoxylase I family protein